MSAEKEEIISNSRVHCSPIADFIKFINVYFKSSVSLLIF